MEDITDNAFRTICHRYGADLTFTEMVRLESLAKKNASTWSRLEFQDETPTIIQLLGTKEDKLSRFLSIFEPSKGFKGFNLNLGCPSPHIVALGQGCAMVKRIARTRELVKIITDRGYKASIKMRLGLNKSEKEKKVYLNLIDAVDADFFVVHARHGGEDYDNPNDYSILPECVATGKTIIANGDIDSLEKIEMLKGIGVKGAMIGRAAVRDPSIFNKLKGVETPSIEKIKEEYLELEKKYNVPFRYQKNVMKHLGEKVEMKQ